MRSAPGWVVDMDIAGSLIGPGADWRAGLKAEAVFQDPKKSFLYPVFTGLAKPGKVKEVSV